MRIWNGLNVNDNVIYKNKEYRVARLYESDNEKLCDLIYYEENNEKIVTGISVKECEKMK